MDLSRFPQACISMSSQSLFPQLISSFVSSLDSELLSSSPYDKLRGLASLSRVLESLLSSLWSSAAWRFPQAGISMSSQTRFCHTGERSPDFVMSVPRDFCRRLYRWNMWRDHGLRLTDFFTLSFPSFVLTTKSLFSRVCRTLVSSPVSEAPRSRFSETVDLSWKISGSTSCLIEGKLCLCCSQLRFGRNLFQMLPLDIAEPSPATVGEGLLSRDIGSRSTLHLMMSVFSPMLASSANPCSIPVSRHILFLDVLWSTKDGRPRGAETVRMLRSIGDSSARLLLFWL